MPGAQQPQAHGNGEIITWIALSKIVPLIWKPEIEDLDAHLVSE